MTAIIQVVVDEVEDVLKVPNAAVRFQPASERRGTASRERRCSRRVGERQPRRGLGPGR